MLGSATEQAARLQVGLDRSAVEETVTDSSERSDASFNLAEQVLAPISTQITLAVEKFSKPI